MNSREGKPNEGGTLENPITPGRLWWLLRRDLKRSVAASWHHYRTLPRIREWRSPFHEEPGNVPVHVLTGANDWQLAAWMLASWFHTTGRNWRIVVHDDGTLPDDARRALESMFSHCRILSRPEADAAMERPLAALPQCAAYRQRHPLGLKIFDMPALTSAAHLLILDSDVLFFKRPADILRWTDNPSDECWFNEDVAEGALVSAEDASATLGVDLWARVNSGLCLLRKEAVDFEFCERALADTSITAGHPWRIEQTLFALCASRNARGGLLPRTYEVSLGKRAAPGTIARHYVGAVRDRFYGEGLERLRKTILR